MTATVAPRLAPRTAAPVDPEQRLSLAKRARLHLLVLAAAQVRITGSPVEPKVWLYLSLLLCLGPAARYAGGLLGGKAGKFDPALALLLATLALSAVVSPYPRIALQASGTIILVSIAGVVIANELPAREILLTLLRTAVFISVVSLLLGFARVPYAIDNGGLLRGICQSKNWLGTYLSLTLVLACLIPHLKVAERAGALTIVALGIAISDSRGGIVGGVAAVGLIVALRMIVLGGSSASLRRAGALLGLAVLGVTLALFGPTLFFSATGRSSDLTGRTQIWRLATEAIFQRPVLGYGHHVFWSDSLSYSASIRSNLGWEVPSAHSAYLEAALWGGVFGFVAMLVLALATLRRVVRAATAKDMHYVAAVACVTFTLMFGLVENAYPSWNVFYVLMVAMALQIARRAERYVGTVSATR